MIFADRDGTIRKWDAGAEAIFGYTASEAVGQSLDLIIPAHLREAHWRGYRRAIASGHTRLGGKPVVTRALHKNGGKLYVEFSFTLVSDEARGVQGALATAKEVTQSYLASRAARNA